MQQDRVTIPTKVMEGIEAVRLSGRTNMLDVPAVISIAIDMGCSQAAKWITDNKNLYAQGVFNGFEPTDSLENPECNIAESKEGDEECADK